MVRQQYQQQTRLLAGEPQREAIIRLIQNLPADVDRPLEIVVRERQKTRRPDQNALYHAGPLKDIAEQVWLDGQQFSAEAYHELFKREFLPEDGTPDADPANGLVKDGYRKWLPTVDGGRHLAGSTTQLTVRGFSQFLDMVHAFGGNRGVEFTAPPAREIS